MAEELYIGLMSGTSLDGIDAALVRFEQHQPCVIDTLCLPLQAELRDEIRLLINPADNELQRMLALDVQLGHAFANAVTTLLQQSGTRVEQIRAIGSHGQTLRHLPTAPHATTLQIGDANIIAEQTGITTVADFRRRDMACGGQGAPLVPAFHEQIFRHHTFNRVILNIGGIANLTLLPADSQQAVIGFDTGPGNTLMNHWIQQQQNRPFDQHGDWAASGTVHDDFVAALLDDPFFQQPAPKSTGTEYFNPAWLSKRLKRFPFVAAEDVQASLAMLTATTIANAINTLPLKVDEVIVCGGGVHNTFLLQLMAQLLPAITWNSSEVHGMDPDYIEATAFAWLARQTLQRQSGNLPEVTGAKRPVILGGVYYAGSE